MIRTNKTREAAVGTVKKSIETSSPMWLSRKIFQFCEGGFLLFGIERETDARKYRFQASMGPHALSARSTADWNRPSYGSAVVSLGPFLAGPVRSSWISGSSKNRNAFAAIGERCWASRYGAHLSNCARIGTGATKRTDQTIEVLGDGAVASERQVAGEEPGFPRRGLNAA